MTIRHLKIFAAVVECSNMHRAAQQLFISQPSVSQAVKELETCYNVKLFDRVSQKLHLTPVGAMYYNHAKRIINSFDNLDLAIKNAATHPVLRFGASISVGTCLLHDILDQLELLFPNIDIHVIVNNTSAIERHILNSDVDLGIVEGSITNPELVLIPVCQDELVIIVGKKHPFYQLDSICLDQLKDQDYISREDESASRNQFEQLLIQNHIFVNKKWLCTNTEAIKEAVIHGRGFSILSKMITANEVKNGSLKIVPVRDVKVERTIHLIYHKDKFLSPIMQEAVKISRTLISEDRG